MPCDADPAGRSRAQVACLLQASRVSAAAHVATWRACSPGMYEYQLEAAFAAACTSGSLPQPGGSAAAQLGYPCIVGAGPNAGVLHYERNARLVEAGDLVLIDAGCEHACYTADITRTFPADGRFGGAARDLYQAVLDVQRLGTASIAAGAVWADIDAVSQGLGAAGGRILVRAFWLSEGCCLDAPLHTTLPPATHPPTHPLPPPPPSPRSLGRPAAACCCNGCKTWASCAAERPWRRWRTPAWLASSCLTGSATTWVSDRPGSRSCARVWVGRSAGSGAGTGRGVGHSITAAPRPRQRACVRGCWV